MKKLWLHYARNGNMGDMLNLDICKNIFNMDVRDSSVNSCECVFIGSIMGDFTKKRSFFNNIYPCPVKVWGTGLIGETSVDVFCRKMEIFAVRGKKTFEAIKRVKNVFICNNVLGDPGLLSSELVPKIQKKYDLGIVPHYIDKQNLPEIELSESSYIIIDVNNNPLECIRQISQCRTILSSSLHGLIIADSFNIPNKRLIITHSLGDYKYEDYYSVYNIENYNPFLNLKEINCETIDIIKSEYIITEKQVDAIKQKLLQSFPYS